MAASYDRNGPHRSTPYPNRSPLKKQQHPTIESKYHAFRPLSIYATSAEYNDVGGRNLYTKGKKGVFVSPNPRVTVSQHHDPPSFLFFSFLLLDTSSPRGVFRGQGIQYSELFASSSPHPCNACPPPLSSIVWRYSRYSFLCMCFSRLFLFLFLFCLLRSFLLVILSSGKRFYLICLTYIKITDSPGSSFPPFFFLHKSMTRIEAAAASRRWDPVIPT